MAIFVPRSNFFSKFPLYSFYLYVSLLKSLNKFFTWKKVEYKAFYLIPQFYLSTTGLFFLKIKTLSQKLKPSETDTILDHLNMCHL